LVIYSNNYSSIFYIKNKRKTKEKQKKNKRKTKEKQKTFLPPKGAAPL